MRRPVKLIIFIILSVLISGCGDPQTNSAHNGSSNQIKLVDIMPKYREPLPPAVNFKVFTFEIPAEYYPAFAGAFNTLNQDSIRHLNRKAFRNNGFTAGLGTQDSWGHVGEMLRRAKAKRVATSTLINYGDTPNDLAVNDIYKDTEISYISTNGKTVTVDQLPGIAVWRFDAKAFPDRRGTAQLKLQALTVQPVNSMIARLPENKNLGEYLFKPASMIMNINEGEFVLLAPAQGFLPATNEKRPPANFIEKINLSDLFFIRRGNFTTPKEKPDLPDEDAKNKRIDVDTFYDVKRDVPLVQIFIISCAGVQN